MQHKMLAGGTVASSIIGAGPRLVLFHSLLADGSSFDGVVAPLSERFEVVVPALPGFGRSAQVEGGLAAVADRMAEAIRDLGTPVRLVGNGYGGFVALLMVIRHPGLVSHLVLADAGAAFSEAGRAAFRGMAMGAAAKGLDAIADIAMRRLFAPAFHETHPEIVAERRACFLRTGPQIVIAACEALAGMDLRAELLLVSIPVLVVVGALDEATPPEMSHELVGLLPDAQLMVLDGLAHVPQLQAPGRFLEAVLPYLSET